MAVFGCVLCLEIVQTTCIVCCQDKPWRWNPNFGHATAAVSLIIFCWWEQWQLWFEWFHCGTFLSRHFHISWQHWTINQCRSGNLACHWQWSFQCWRNRPSLWSHDQCKCSDICLCSKQRSFHSDTMILGLVVISGYLGNETSTFYCFCSHLDKPSDFRGPYCHETHDAFNWPYQFFKVLNKICLGINICQSD